MAYMLGEEYLPSRFLSYLNTVLLEMVFGQENFLLISCPPRHGKSFLCSYSFPAWFLGLFPDRRVLLGSYEATFAHSWGRKTRDLLTQKGMPLFGVRVRSDVSAVAEWQVAGREGGMITAGVEGGFTGKGGHLIIIDDLVKNRAEAESKVHRDRAWSFFNSTVWPRREPGASVLVIMQRWHQDDLIGRIKREMPESGYREICFPAVAEEEDVLGRAVGEPLFPARYPAEELEALKKNLVPYYWESQYQQHPSSPQGSIFKRENWQYYEAMPEKFDMIFQSWDMTFKKTDDSNKVAGHTWGKKGPNYYLIDRVCERMGFTDSLEAARAARKKWPQTRAVLIEDKANGPAIMDVLKREISGIIAIEPEGGKVARAHAVEPLHRAGNIFLPDPTQHPWVKEFVEILANFPTGAEDDDVDSFTQAVNWCESRKIPGAFIMGGRA